MNINYFRMFLIICTLPALVLSGCSTLTVRSLGDDTVEFSKYKRFAVIEPESLPPNVDPRVNEITMRRINRVIEEQLLISGFYKTTKEEAEFLIASYANVEGKIDVTSYGYNYGYYGHYRGWGGSDTVVREYDQGTLIIDFIDAHNNSLIWRGWATGRIADDPDLARMREAVAKILAQYPPM